MTSESREERLLPVFERISEHLVQMGLKLDRTIERREKVLKFLKDREEGEVKPLDAMALLSLPDHLKKTAMALLRLREATADRVAGVTGRARAVESCYLNRLVGMRLIERKRRGRIVYFSARTEGQSGLDEDLGCG